jgi:diadenosine tetraphosphatase ApaH/serine/threonine PP2A family protein phosphatase
VLALLYDVHGNLAALDAVLEDARGQGVESWLIGGDVSAFGPWPEATVERLQSLGDAQWLRGNHERWAIEGDEVPPIPFAQHGVAATREALGAETVAELYTLPLWQPIPGGEAWHASPRSDVDGLLPEPQEHDAALLESRTPELLVVGHTHLPTQRTITRSDGGTTRVVNPGSVGLPFDGDPRAAYGILHDDGRVELRRVDYDRERAIAENRARWGDAVWARTMDETYRSGRPAAL